MDDVDFKESTVNPNITVSTWDDDQMGKEMERREAYKEEEVNEEQRINKGKRLFCTYPMFVYSAFLLTSAAMASHCRLLTHRRSDFDLQHLVLDWNHLLRLVSRP